MNYNVYGVSDFCLNFGISEEELPEKCKELIKQCDFSYRFLEGMELDKAYLDELKRIDSDNQIIASAKRTDDWENGWRTRSWII